MASIVILGVGNTLMSDDGLGIRAVEYLQQHGVFADAVTLLSAGTSAMALRRPLAACDWAILLDAIVAETPVGSLYSCHDPSLLPRLSRGLSAHHLGLADLLKVLEMTGELPARLSLFGLVPGRVEPGLVLSPPVSAAIPQLSGAVVDCLQQQGITARLR